MQATAYHGGALDLAIRARPARTEANPEPAEPIADTRHGVESAIAGLGLYGALLLCLVAFA